MADVEKARHDVLAVDEDPDDVGEPVLPVVAIVGRPNVGKSTLFNRLIGERRAIVADEPGTTRDRIVARVERDGGPFILIDTGGLYPGSDQPLVGKVHEQVRAALADADVVVFLTDGVAGPMPGDAEVAAMLHRSDRPMVLAVNKCESDTRLAGVVEFYRLGLGDPIPISAIRGEGIGDLMDSVEAHLPPSEPQETPADLLRLALVGRPNVGKSSLLNTITGEERAIVDEVPGTTRDSLDSWVSYRDQPLVLIDTAGIRRRGHIEPGVEKFSALRSLQAIERSNVAILVLDAEEMMTAQDSHVAGYVIEAYRGLIVAVNKWDVARQTGVSAEWLLREVRRKLHWAPYVPVHFTSAVTGEGVPLLMNTALEIFEERRRTIPQGDLSRVLTDAIGRHAPPSYGRRQLRFSKVEQTGVHPPTFTFSVNRPELVHFSYRRYLQNTFRSHFGFRGSLLRFNFQRTSGARRR